MKIIIVKPIIIIKANIVLTHTKSGTLTGSPHRKQIGVDLDIPLSLPLRLSKCIADT